MSDNLFIKILLIIIILTMCLFTCMITDEINNLQEQIRISLKNN